jgi:hypothetical protein
MRPVPRLFKGLLIRLLKGMYRFTFLLILYVGISLRLAAMCRLTVEIFQRDSWDWI